MGKKQSKIPCSYSDIDLLFQTKKQKQMEFFSKIEGFSEMSCEWIPYVRDRLAKYNKYIWTEELTRFVNTWNAHQDVRSKIALAWLFYMRSTQPKPKKQITRTQLRNYIGQCRTFTILLENDPYMTLVYDQLAKDKSNALYQLIQRFGAALKMEFTNYHPSKTRIELKEEVIQNSAYHAELLTNYIKGFISILTDSLNKFYLNLDQHIKPEAQELIATHAVLSGEILELLVKTYFVALKSDQDEYSEHLRRLKGSDLHSLSLDESLRINNGEGYFDAIKNLVDISYSTTLTDILDKVSQYSNNIKSSIDNHNPDKNILLETDKFLEISMLLISKASSPNLPTMMKIAENFLHPYFKSQEMEYVITTIQGAVGLLKTCSA
ncbi:unnamed protein product [Blepharisma stoltei]|uniref:VPS9 domain-containing protein n=1 Tax=Blepharisma stoltei TaxID=1481888 RepID=A0AAU9JL32_9CILI|nr:unnamed protein product [Blepharisma stoltei]